MRSLSADEALEELLAGNRRYIAMRQLYPRQNQMRRQALLDGQYPFAAVLSCSDSRVPSELIFDQGLGDLFIVRTAGHVIDPLILGSLEFAVHVLRVPLIVVMGHAQCGAVTSAVKGQSLPGNIRAIAEALQPVIAGVRDSAGDPVLNATHANAIHTADRLIHDSAILAEAAAQDRLKIAPAYFDLKTSTVQRLREG